LGKSYAILVDPLRDVSNPNFRGLIVRRTTEELRDLIIESKKLYPKIFKKAEWKERDKTWVFPSGATLWFSYLDHDDDVLRYQGQQFTWVGFDELTQWPTPFAWNYLSSRMRSTDPTLAPVMRACVDYGNVLTTKGWKPVQDVKKGEFVYSLTSGGALVEKLVTDSFKYYVEEDLLKIEKKNLKASMTPDHRVVYNTYGSNEPKLIRFNEHGGKSIDIVRSSSSYSPESSYTPNLLGFDEESFPKFLGWYIAEGSYNTTVRNGNHKVIITQLKPQNQEEVLSVMKASGCNVSYSANGDFQITSKELRGWVSTLGKAKDKHFPREFLEKASYKQLEDAFNCYSKGDGHWQSDKSCTLTTTSLQLSKDLLEIAVKLGYKAQYTTIHSDNPEHATRYKVYFHKTQKTKVDKGEKRNDTRLEPYKGYVYCISVQDCENFFIEQDGYVWASGNTTNPGGPGGWWVKRMFIDPAPAGEAFWATDIDTGEVMIDTMEEIDDGVKNPDFNKPLYKRRFIPAKLRDNPHLTKDGSYRRTLMALPEAQRRQLLDGDWNTNEGVAFPEWREALHTIDPEEYLNGVDDFYSWKKFRACDYGYGSYSGVLWFAIAPNGSLVVYREMYTHKVLAEDLANMILAAEASDGNIMYGVLDSSCWHNRGDRGPSIAERMIRRGCRWRPADRSKGSRVSGKNEVHRLLKVNEFSGEPSILVFNTCRNLITYLPSIPLDKNNPEDVDTHYAHDHLYDALRYGVMSRPKPFGFDDGVAMAPQFKPFDETFGY